jgi:hypothetical protein
LDAAPFFTIRAASYRTRAVELDRKTQSVVASYSATRCVRQAKADGLIDVADGKANTGLCFDGFAGLTTKLVSMAGATSPARSPGPWDSANW